VCTHPLGVVVEASVEEGIDALVEHSYELSEEILLDVSSVV
jgi:hypothetical protein